ncbi:MAG: hypothetical protein GDYSWBUE_000278 [Candidatus Fervidibacterota bacterium]
MHVDTFDLRELFTGCGKLNRVFHRWLWKTWGNFSGKTRQKILKQNFFHNFHTANNNNNKTE